MGFVRSLVAWWMGGAGGAADGETPPPADGEPSYRINVYARRNGDEYNGRRLGEQFDARRGTIHVNAREVI